MVVESSAIATGMNALVATTASGSTGPSLLSTFLDRLSLLSPQTWWGLWNVLVENPFTTWNGQALIRSIIGFLLPFMLLRILLLLLPSTIISSTAGPGLQRAGLLWTTLLSPWTISCFTHILQQLASPLQSLASYHQERFRVLPEAETILQQCLEEGRATWTRNFVVFWPLPSSKSTSSPSDRDAPSKGIWIIPGALVPHIAYAPIAERLSKAGFVVVIQSLEPTRLAHPILLTAKQLQKHWNHPLFSSPAQNKINWTLLGHSMGSFYCMKLARVLPIHKIVLWGMASFLHLGTDLSDDTTTMMDILVIQASNDALRDMTKQYRTEFQQLLPPTTTQQRTISGGTHDGFASYQAPMTSTTDSSGMTPNEQQALACEWTVHFLSNTTRTTHQNDKDDGNS
jgi:hypothetical protein